MLFSGTIWHAGLQIRSDCKLYSYIQQVPQVLLVALNDSVWLTLSSLFDKYKSRGKSVYTCFEWPHLPPLAASHFLHELTPRDLCLLCVFLKSNPQRHLWCCTSWCWSNRSICVKKEKKKAWERSPASLLHLLPVISSKGGVIDGLSVSESYKNIGKVWGTGFRH